MEIHELNTFSGTPGANDYFATDNGSDTSKISADALMAPLNARIDNIIAGGTAPSAAEVTDARLGAAVLGSVQYNSLGDAIRGQATAVDAEVTDLKKELINNLKYLNCYNYLTDYAITANGSGVTYSRTNDGGIKLSGTASGLYFVNYYVGINQMPSNLVNGKKYKAIFHGTNVVLNVYFYKNGSYLTGYDITTPTEFTVPSDATGAVIRLKVNSGVTVNETVYAFITDNTSILYKGSISNNLNVDDLSETGIYLLTGNTSTPTLYGTLIHSELSDAIKTQIIFELVDLRIWYRRSLNGTWYPWYTYGYADLYHETNYYAFGDSLMWGALWNGTADNPVITQAPSGSRIPDRINHAIKGSDYNNCSVGGMAYTVANGNIPKMIDYIRTLDISNADLITIAGGRNDGSSPLGTSNSSAGDGTICGAIREIIEYIRGVNPSCQMVVIQVTPYTSNNNPWTATSSSGWSLDSFDEQVSVLCKNLNVGYASWYGCSMFSRWSDFSGGGGNWAHMKDAEQYIQMGNFIAGQVCKYYQN